MVTRRLPPRRQHPFGDELVVDHGAGHRARGHGVYDGAHRRRAVAGGVHARGARFLHAVYSEVASLGEGTAERSRTAARLLERRVVVERRDLDGSAVGEGDGLQVAVVLAKAHHAVGDHGYIGSRGLAYERIGGAVGEERESVGPVADETDEVQGRVAAREDAGRLVGVFVAVAVGAVDNGFAPALGVSGQLGQEVLSPVPKTTFRAWTICPFSSCARKALLPPVTLVTRFSANATVG